MQLQQMGHMKAGSAPPSRAFVDSRVNRSIEALPSGLEMRILGIATSFPRPHCLQCGMRVVHPMIAHAGAVGRDSIVKNRDRVGIGVGCGRAGTLLARRRGALVMQTMRMVGVGLAAAMVLSGCLSLDADLAVNSDATATGELTFEVNQQAAALLGITSSESLVSQLRSGELEGAEATRNLDCSAVDRTGAIAVSCLFVNQEFAEPGELWWITSDDSTVTFHSRGGDAGDDSGAAELFGSVFSSGGYTINVRMPGPISSVSGEFVQQTSENSVRIKASLTDEFDVVVVSAKGPGGGDTPVWLWLVLGVVVLIAIGLVAFLITRRGKKQDPEPFTEPFPELPPA